MIVRDTVTFIEKAKQIWGDRFTYENAEYTGTSNHIIITCPTHGDFKKQPHGFLSKGQHCPGCSLGNKSNKTLRAKKFIEKATKVHEGKYLYRESDYISSKEKMPIHCTTCDITFNQDPTNHARGKGCPKCAKERMIVGKAMQKEDFLIRAKEVHGDRYTYLLSEFKNGSTRTPIHCRAHNSIFYQKPTKHLQGNGCPKCALYERRYTENAEYVMNQTATLYHVRFTNEEGTFDKVGITTNTIDQRFHKLKEFDIEIIHKVTLPLVEAARKENEIFLQLDKTKQRYKIHALKGTGTNGWTECFRPGAIDVTPWFT